MWAVCAFAFGPGVLLVAMGASRSHVAVWRLKISVTLIALSGAAEGKNRRALRPSMLPFTG